jgi:2-oxoacid:acceptor oxidoreductase gamma subunit (pyruvate/2-ketoisovalerate family)/2-oxoacid:acceptor oxidoreductase delta subunit (pyruvate/2-ketoisovalerate family)
MKLKKIRFHGRGGQGVVVASIVMGKALLIKGLKKILSMPFFGVERRGAPVLAFLYIGTTSARYAISKPDCLVILHSALIGPEIVRGLKKNGLIVINSDKRPEDFFYLGPFTIATVNAEKIAHDCGISAVNTTILGAVAKASNMVMIEQLSEAISETDEIPHPERNIVAATKAFAQTKIGKSTNLKTLDMPMPLLKQGKKYEPGLIELIKTVAITLTDTSEIHTGSWRVNRPVLDETLCKKCKNNPRCELFCPEMAIIIKDDHRVEIDYRYCKGCGICARKCPFKAISMISETEAVEIKNGGCGTIEEVQNEKK